MNFYALRDVSWETFSAIGTISAVIVSLWLAKPKQQRNIRITQAFESKYKRDSLQVDYIILKCTLENIGDVPVIFDDLGFLCKGNDSIKDDILTEIKEKRFPMLIRPNEAELITVIYRPNDYLYEDARKGLLIFRDSWNKIHRSQINYPNQ